MEPAYRDWDADPRNSGRDVGFLHPNHPATPPEILAQVRPLAEDYARWLWRRLVPTREPALPLIEKPNWIWDVFAKRPFEWSSTDGKSAAAVKQYLRGKIPWPSEERVFFLHREGYGYQTTWGTFLDTWQRFVAYETDGVLFHPEFREVVAFFEVNAVWVGRRSKRRLT